LSVNNERDQTNHVQALQENAKNLEHKESCRVLATGKRTFHELPR